MNDSEDEFVPTADSEDESVDQEDDLGADVGSVLTAEELRIANIIQPRPDTTPLSLNSIKKRLDSIIRHFAIRNLKFEDGFRESVLKIMNHLARHKRLYPTGQRKKRWITDDHIAALRGAVWSAAAHDVGSNCGAHSIVNLLSIHLIIMFLHELGRHITSWLDKDSRRKGEEGWYLRWGMVEVGFIGYSDTGRPQFLLNVSCNSSKLSGRYGDLKFQMNTMAT